MRGDDAGGLTARTDEQRHGALRQLARREIDGRARLTIGTASTRSLGIRPANVADDADDLVQPSIAFERSVQVGSCPATNMRARR